MIEITLAPSGALRLRVESFTGASNHIEVPLTVGGLSIIKKILQARANGTKAHLGTDAQPTQEMVRQWLAQNKVQTERPKSTKGIANWTPESDELKELMESIEL